jgi:cation-transporting ATPase E
LVKNIFSLGLAMLSLISGWAYPMIPIHLTVVAALTIGVPSFFLAMEPNYERVTGRFLWHVLRKALPGGLTNIIVVMLAQAFMRVFDLPAEQTSAACAAVLATVGLLVLFETCKPFGTFRKAVWGTMAVALVGCFTLLRGFFELQLSGDRMLLILAALLLVTPTVFYLMNHLVNFCEKLMAKVDFRLPQITWE